MSAVDEEKVAAVRELQARFEANSSKLKQLESQRRQNEVAQRRAAFTAQHLNEVPDEVTTYTAVGKAYFLEPKSAVMSRLEATVRESRAEIKAAVAAREGLEKAQQGLLSELDELMGTPKGP